MFPKSILSLLLLLSTYSLAAPSAKSESNPTPSLAARPQSSKSYELTYAGTCCPIYWEVPLVKLLPEAIMSRTREENLISSIVGNATGVARVGRKRVEFVLMGENERGIDWAEDAARREVVRIDMPCPLGRASKVKTTHLATLTHYQVLSNSSVSVHCGIEGDYLFLGVSA